MVQVTESKAAQRLVLQAETAAELMSRMPVSIDHEATLAEAATFLIEKELSAAPVIDNAGRPVGVLSRSDIVRFDSESASARSEANSFYHVADLLCPPALREMLQARKPEHVLVRDVMTPTVLSIAPDASALSVVAELLAMKVHRLFVVDSVGVLVGVISTFDVLRKLRL